MSVTADLMDPSSTGPGTVHDYGDQALLLEFDSTAEVLAWADALREAELLGVLDIVPASRTVLLKLAGPRYQAPTRQRLGKLRVTAEARVGRDRTRRRPRRHRDRRGVRRRRPRRGGPAHRDDHRPGDRRAHRHPVAGRIRRLRTGFRVSVGGDERLNVPRQSEPRTRVPAGSVALAGEFSGVYPRESPGGWQLIGRTDAELWDVDRDPPALLRPGMWVQFREVRS